MSGDLVRVRQVIAELELLSHGSVQSWNSAGGHTDESHTMPTPDVYPHDYWAARLVEAGDDPELLKAVLKGAEAELAKWRGRGSRPEPQGETAEEFDARIIKKGEGWEIDLVAIDFNTTPTRVRRARREAGRDEMFGKPRTRENLSDVERRRRAKELRDRHNLSVRQIAAQLGCGVGTVHRDLAA